MQAVRTELLLPVLAESAAHKERMVRTTTLVSASTERWDGTKHVTGAQGPLRALNLSNACDQRMEASQCTDKASDQNSVRVEGSEIVVQCDVDRAPCRAIAATRPSPIALQSHVPCRSDTEGNERGNVPEKPSSDAVDPPRIRTRWNRPRVHSSKVAAPPVSD